MRRGYGEVSGKPAYCGIKRIYERQGKARDGSGREEEKGEGNVRETRGNMVKSVLEEKSEGRVAG